MAITPEDAKAVASRSECLFTDAQVQVALDKMAVKVTTQIENKNPLVICVMNGGLIVTAELLKRFNFPLEVDYLHASRYGDALIGDSLTWHAEPKKVLKNRTILIVDDILDVGRTLQEIIHYCENAGAEKVYTAVLTEKEHDRKVGDLKADFTALQVPDRYVYGYGMDYKQYLRNSAGIYAAAKIDE